MGLVTLIAFHNNPNLRADTFVNELLDVLCQYIYPVLDHGRNDVPSGRSCDAMLCFSGGYQAREYFRMRVRIKTNKHRQQWSFYRSLAAVLIKWTKSRC